MTVAEVCSGCQKPPHAGGCRVAFSAPPAPSAEELQRRRDYLASPEFLRERDAAMAGRNPRPATDLRDQMLRLLRDGYGPGGGFYEPDQRVAAAVSLLEVGWGSADG